MPDPHEVLAVSLSEQQTPMPETRAAVQVEALSAAGLVVVSRTDPEAALEDVWSRAYRLQDPDKRAAHYELLDRLRAAVLNTENQT